MKWGFVDLTLNISIPSALLDSISGTIGLWLSYGQVTDMLLQSFARIILDSLITVCLMGTFGFMIRSNHSKIMARTTQGKILYALKSLYCNLEFVAVILQNELTNPNGTDTTSVCRYIWISPWKIQKCWIVP